MRDSSAHRFCFFASPTPLQELWEIVDEEFHHLSKVLRLKPGTTVELMDGVTSRIVTGVITEFHKGSCHVRVLEEKIVKPAEGKSVLLLGALDHREVDKIIPSLVELGLSSLVVFLDEGLQKDRITPAKLTRWNEISRDAQKQCKRPLLLEMRLAPSLKEYLIDQTDNLHDSVRLVFSSEIELEHLPQDKDAITDSLSNAGLKKKVTFGCVGPEKGLSKNLYHMLRRDYDFKPCTLGNYTLRATTAAVAATVVLNREFGV